MSVIQIKTTSNINDAMKCNYAVILKHSTRCPISAAAKREFDEISKERAKEIELYYVDIIQHRDMSMEIEKITGIPHESPQIMIVKDGKVVWHASHWDISRKTILKAIEENDS